MFLNQILSSTWLHAGTGFVVKLCWWHCFYFLNTNLNFRGIQSCWFSAPNFKDFTSCFWTFLAVFEPDFFGFLPEGGLLWNIQASIHKSGGRIPKWFKCCSLASLCSPCLTLGSFGLDVDELWKACVCSSHSERIGMRQSQVDKLYAGLKDLSEERRGKLDERFRLFQLNREVDDLEQWIAEREVVAGSHELGQDYEHVTVSQNQTCLCCWLNQIICI